MSPEQALGLPVSAASDWYSIGVILYQALTGRLPFEGTFEEVVLQKQTVRPTSPRPARRGPPRRPVVLCLELLDRDPDGRPAGHGRSSSGCGAGPVPPIARRPGRPIPLIGRTWHRQVARFRLRLAREPARPRRSSSSAARAPGRRRWSGPSSTELCEAEDAVVLSGRCYEQEWVPFKAVDSLVDALARHLKRLPSRELERLLPRDVSVAGPGLPGACGRSTRHSAAPTPLASCPTRRSSGSGSSRELRELLVRLGEGSNLVLMIDDLQWGDADSAALLADLIHIAGPPAMLFLGLLSAGGRRTEPVPGDPPPGRRTRALDGASISTSWRSRRSPRRSRASWPWRCSAATTPSRGPRRHLIARESGGNPLFIEQLVKHIQADAAAECWNATGGLDLETVLWARVQAQPADAQRLLEVVSASGRPIHELLAFRAAELGTSGRVALGSLRSARLIRGVGPARLDEIETYHDRIRETVLAISLPESLRWHHERLAHVLESAGHGRPGRAGRSLPPSRRRPAGPASTTSGAADKASSVLAFDQAARLYRRALELKRRLGRGPAPARAGSWATRWPTAAGAPRPPRPTSRRPGTHRRGDPGADPAGLDPAPHQRPRGRGAGAPADHPRPAGAEHAHDAPAGPRRR